MIFWSANHTCRCDHGKRNIFWFHENAQNRKYAYFIHQGHISAWPKSRQIHNSFCGGCPVHSLAESACEPHQTLISALLRFCCVRKCSSRTRLAHISDYCSLSHKNHKRWNMLQNRARNTCGICTCHGCLRNDSVARHFLHKGDCHSRISSRLSRKLPRYSNKRI